MVRSKINYLNRKLELQKFEKTQDGAGGFLGEWVTVKYLWGNIQMISNTQDTKFSTLEIKATHMITLRKINIINFNMRFIYNNDIYNIKYIDNLDNNFMELICEKLSNLIL
jgi:SPP1 family predicted phage head-tail adaptor